VRPGDVFLDLGAHTGLYSLAMSRAVGPAGTVLAVEAHPETFRRLCTNLRLNGATNVRPLQLGVADTRQSLRLLAGTDGFVAASSFLAGAGEGIEVPAEPLLDILREQGVTAVAGAKFDIEGFEYRVLARFLAEADRNLWPRSLVIEHQPTYDSVSGGNAIALLESHGYRTERKESLNYFMVRSS
jgi:FkbM family methyltransferase